MQGYYREPQATDRVLDDQGWLHTGDLGEITSDGFLKITGVKKSLFKLATGKYVSPLPLEQELNQSPLVAHAIAVGANHKFCGMLIVPNLDALRTTLEEYGVTTEDEFWLEHSCALALYQTLIDRANCHLPYWSTVRRFKLIDAHFTVENGLLNPDGTINRMQVFKAFADEIASLYENEPEIQKHDGDQDGEPNRESDNAKDETAKQAVSLSPVVSCPQVPGSSCPIYAKSLTHY
jgi:long-chain acyl-CoA synthetase